jgi:Capsule assembly protein Wzi/PAP2 superfamily
LLLLLFINSLGSTPIGAFPQAQSQEQTAGKEKDKTPAQSTGAAGTNDQKDGTPVPLSQSAKGLGVRFLKDQEQIWTSPAHLTWADADILVPVGVATGGFLATDTDFSKHLSNSPSRLNNSLTFSDVGVGALIGAGGGLYAWGQLTHDEHKKETGFISGEAAVNALVVTEALKFAFGRTRPLENPKYQGNFFQGGSSFPSEHASASWAIASVIAHEYPGTLTGVLLYGLAGAVSMSRVTAKQHFPTDVFIGSLIGWYVGKQAYRAHHDPELGGSEWLSYGEFKHSGGNERSSSLGTTFVPLSSWIYPAMKRLVALGYIQSQFMDMQPWTRVECARMVQEAGERIADSPNATEEVNGIYQSLLKEFAIDTDRLGGGSSTDTTARLESMYTRVTDISGPSLHDSYHFGQTLIDDFGRPYGSGINAIAGGSAWVTQGRFAIYVSGEYEYAPGSPTYSPAVNNAIATMDSNPVQPGTFPSTSQFRLLDTYVSSNQDNWIFSFGKQSLWWSPDYSNAFIMGDNSAPIYMFRITREEPFEIPYFSKLVGKMKVDFFIGKLSGNGFPARPSIHGEKITFKPVPNAEFGFSRTSEFGGACGTTPPCGMNRAITPKAIWLSYFSLQNSDTFAPGAPNPGKRTSGFDFNYRVPYLRNWLTLYTDSLATDNVSPWADVSRAAWAPGIYLTHFPKLSKLDLRLEASYTDVPKLHNGSSTAAFGKFNYWDSYYHDLYTNEGFIIGSWVGREGHGYQAWTTYHASARNWIQFGYRHADVANDFIPGGGNITDGSVSMNWWARNDLNLTGMLQYERWNYPLLAPVPQTNWTSSVGINFYPASLRLPVHSNAQAGN